MPYIGGDKMKSKNIFIGTIKKCNSLYWYKQYGNEKYIGDFKIGRTEIGTIHRYFDIIDKIWVIKMNEIETNILSN